MKKIFNKIGQVLQMVLAAPVKLPGKALNILKYVALGLGVLEKVLEEKKPPSEISLPDSQSAIKTLKESADKNSSSENNIGITVKKGRLDEME